MKSTNPVILSVKHHRQNPLDSTSRSTATLQGYFYNGYPAILLSCRHRKRIKVCSVAECVVVTIGMLSPHLPLETPVSLALTAFVTEVLLFHCCSEYHWQFVRVIHCRNISRTMFIEYVFIVSRMHNHLAICYTYFSEYLYLFTINSFHLQSVPVTNSMVWIRGRTIPTERPPLVGELIVNFLRIEGATWSAWRIPTAVFSVF
jgi:hypothetical protein